MPIPGCFYTRLYCKNLSWAKAKSYHVRGNIRQSHFQFQFNLAHTVDNIYFHIIPYKTGSNVFVCGINLISNSILVLKHSSFQKVNKPVKLCNC